MEHPDDKQRRRTGVYAFLYFYVGAMALIILLEVYRNYEAGGGFGW